MRERSELILADLIQIRAEQEPDLDVLTFEHLSLDGGKTPAFSSAPFHSRPSPSRMPWKPCLRYKPSRQRPIVLPGPKPGR